MLGTEALLLLTYILYKTFHVGQFFQTSSSSASEFNSGFPESPTGKVPNCLFCDSLATILLPAVLAFRLAHGFHGTLIAVRGASWQATVTLRHQQAVSPVSLLAGSSGFAVYIMDKYAEMFWSWDTCCSELNWTHAFKFQNENFQIFNFTNPFKC